MPVKLLRRKFTVEQYHQMAQSGILKDEDRVELLKEKIFDMSPIGRHHAAYVKRLNALFNQRLADTVIVGVQKPVELANNSAPQPDIVMLLLCDDFYEAENPQLKDALLLVEVADTTIEFDREIKIYLYTSSGIYEVWVVDINEQCLEVYRQHSIKGYQIIQKYCRGQSLTITAFPDISFTLDEVLG